MTGKKWLWVAVAMILSVSGGCIISAQSVEFESELGDNRASSLANSLGYTPSKPDGTMFADAEIPRNAVDCSDPVTLEKAGEDAEQWWRNTHAGQKPDDAAFQEIGKLTQELCGATVVSFDADATVDYVCEYRDWREGGYLCFKSRLTCDVNWDQECDDTHTFSFKPSDDVQFCKLEWKVFKDRGKDNGFEIEPINPIPDEPGLTGRFRGIKSRFYSRGNGVFYNKLGAAYEIGDFRAVVLPLWASEQTRNKLGCYRYNKPQAAARPAPAPPLYSKENVGTGRKFTFSRRVKVKVYTQCKLPSATQEIILAPRDSVTINGPPKAQFAELALPTNGGGWQWYGWPDANLCK